MIIGAAQVASLGPAVAQTDSDWTMGGYDTANTRSNPAEQTLSTKTVSGLATKWTFTTRGDVSATPAVVGGAVYFPDWGGLFSKVDARTGQVIWQHSIPDYVGIADAVSRTSPAVVGSTVYIGTQRGARLLAIDTATGNLRWSTALDDHPDASLTQSPMVHDGVVYEGVSSQEEVTAIDPGYDCCTFRGSLTAVDAKTGQIRWKTYMTPEPHGGTADSYSGVGVWSGTPAIDPDTGTVYVTTGNNYSVPQSAEQCQQSGGTAGECLSPDDHLDSIVALDAGTGRIKWTAGPNTFDTWNAACVAGPPPNNCPTNPGGDFDFGDGAHLLTVNGPAGPRKLVGAGEKSGVYWMVDATTGQVVWSAAPGPGSAAGGIQWGTATDGRRVYLTENDFSRIPYQLADGQTIDYASFAALDPATGRVIWQIPEPHQALAQAAVSVANGVMYAGSLDGHMYAIDAATGQVLWQASGQGSVGAGPAISDGSVYWGNGYSRAIRGIPGTTFYSFAIPASQ